MEEREAGHGQLVGDDARASLPRGGCRENGKTDRQRSRDRSLADRGARHDHEPAAVREQQQDGEHQPERRELRHPREAADRRDAAAEVRSTAYATSATSHGAIRRTVSVVLERRRKTAKAPAATGIATAASFESTASRNSSGARTGHPAPPRTIHQSAASEKKVASRSNRAEIQTTAS